MNDYTALFRAALEWVKTGRPCPDCGDNWLVIQEDGVTCWLCGRRLARVEPNVSQWRITKTDGTSELL